MLVVLTETYCNKVNIQITQRDDFIQIVYMFWNNVSYIMDECPYILCIPSACRIYITTITVIFTTGTPTGCLSCEMSFVYLQSQLLYSQKT